MRLKYQYENTGINEHGLCHIFAWNETELISQFIPVSRSLNAIESIIAKSTTGTVLILVHLVASRNR